MARFKITYADPETEELIITTEDFFDSDNITAEEWAEDFAYAKADKGFHTVEKLIKRK